MLIKITCRQWFALGFVFACLATLAYCGKEPLPERTATTPGVLPFVVTGAVDHGYLGWSVCAECHSRRVEEFQETRHFLVLRLPDQMEFPRGFHPGVDPFVPRGSPVRFEMTATPEAAIMTTPVAANSVGKTVSPIAYAYGAGAGTDEVYFTRRGEEIFEMPVVWLYRQNCWGQFRLIHTGLATCPDRWLRSAWSAIPSGSTISAVRSTGMVHLSPNYSA